MRMPAKDRKQEIEAIALKLAFQVGPTQVTTGMIAAEMGLTQPAIYKHFPSKDDIWAEVSRHLSQRILLNISQVLATKAAPVEQLRQLVVGHLQVVKEHPALPEFMILRDTRGGNLILRNVIQAAMVEFRAALTSNVQAAVEAGDFRKAIVAQDAATLIFGVIQSLVLRMLVTRNVDVLTDDGARLLELQLAGFSPKGEIK